MDAYAKYLRHMEKKRNKKEKDVQSSPEDIQPSPAIVQPSPEDFAQWIRKHPCDNVTRVKLGSVCICTHCREEKQKAKEEKEE